MSRRKTFFSYVIPSVLAFALSGVYAIVDGFFVGNSIGDVGLSAMNIAYPVTALIQAIGAGIGMGGAVCFAIARAEKREAEARDYAAGTLWLLLLASIVVTVIFSCATTPILRLLGAQGELMSLGRDYLLVIALGASLQILGTGLVPMIRNHGGALFAMMAMVMGFLTNIVLDYLFIWVYEWGTTGAAIATIIGQGVALSAGLFYLWRKGQLTFKLPRARLAKVWADVARVGLAPFGLTLTPNFSLILINRFSVGYGGEEAIAVYACISYVISIVYLLLQGVGDGSQPLMSRYYGEQDQENLGRTRRAAYTFSLALSGVSMAVLFAARWQVGLLLGASDAVIVQVARVFPIFLLTIPFIAFTRITTAGFYATEKSVLSYLLTYVEPVAMLVLLLVLPPLFGGQRMIWWGAALTQLACAALAMCLKRYADTRRPLPLYLE